MVLESVGTYVGGKLFDWAIPRGIVVLSGTAKNRATRNAFEDAAVSALADVAWELSTAPSDEESARVLAEHLGTWLTEPSVAEKLFRAANAKVQADSKVVVELMEQTGFEVSIVPFDMKDFVTAFVPRLSEVVDREMRSQGLTETVITDKLDELLSRTEPRESAIRAAIPAADGPGRRAVLVGVRSFTRRAEDMEEMDHLLRLENHFDGRRIRSPELWREAVYPELDAFLGGNLNGHDRYLLHLSAHTTIAFACGYLLDPKSGVDVVPVQRTGGKQEWRPAVDPGEARHGLPEELWTLKPVPLRENGPDIVMALSMTRDVLEDAVEYARENIPTAGRILGFEVASGAGQHSVRDGTHALLLADELMTRFDDARSPDERTGTVHLFAAAPAGFTFFAGRLARGLRRCVLYEFDFEGGALGAYEPSLAFPPPVGGAGRETEIRGG
jgi:hypothetical protein